MKLNDNEYQSLVGHAKGKYKTKSHDHTHKTQGFKRPNKYFSNYECFTCHKLGHIAINCPMKAERVKNMKRFQAHTTEDSDQEIEEEAKKYEESIEEHLLISSLTWSVSLGNDTWLFDSRASKHMSGYKDSLSCLVQKESPHKVMLGGDSQYRIKGMGEASYKLDSGKSMKMRDVLYVLGLKKNLLSIWYLDKRGFRLSFIDGKVLMWSKGKTTWDLGHEACSYSLQRSTNSKQGCD